MKCGTDGTRASAVLWLQETPLCWSAGQIFAPGEVCYAGEKYVPVTTISVLDLFIKGP